MLGALEQYEAATRPPGADLRRQRCKMALSVKYCGEHLKACPAKSVSFTGILLSSHTDTYTDCFMGPYALWFFCLFVCFTL